MFAQELVDRVRPPVVTRFSLHFPRGRVGGANSPASLRGQDWILYQQVWASARCRIAASGWTRLSIAPDCFIGMTAIRPLGCGGTLFPTGALFCQCPHLVPPPAFAAGMSAFAGAVKGTRAATSNARATGALIAWLPHGLAVARCHMQEHQPLGCIRKHREHPRYGP